MAPKVLFETDKTIITDSTILRDGEVYYINQIANMKITDDFEDIKRAKYFYNEEKKDYLIGFFKYLIIGIFFFLLGLEYGFFLWVAYFLFFVAVYKIFKWINMPEFEEPELTYTLTINFSDGSRLKLYGNKEIIDNLKNAITQALHMK